MYEEQATFTKTFEGLERIVLSFHTNNSIANHETIMRMCSEVTGKLQNLNEQSRKFNSREILFNLDQTDYARLQQVTKEFTPYNTLWSIVHRWYTDIDIWMDNPFNDIDANAA